ncbi:hypothetical protein FRC20_009184 [Serendipita sp. 405]|nr:hypothetical protein FRC20_009184 [Serendipita sp. 405]
MDFDLNLAIEEITAICKASDGRSRIFEYGSSGYKDGVRHFLESSSDVALVAVCPGTTNDVSKIMKVLANHKVPFGVKGGGHTTNPKFSSTTGIQLYMSFFDKVEYDSSKKTLAVGSGCLWDQVYREILAKGRYVIGGSATEGVGVAGIDNIVEFEVVIPNGDIIRTGSSGPHSDLFRALKGGGNNFGIVTEFVIKTYEIEAPNCELMDFSNSKSEEVKAAITDFINDEETQKAVLIAAFRHYNETVNDQSWITVFCVKNLPQSAKDPFQKFYHIERKPERGQNRRNMRRVPGLRIKVVAEEEHAGGSMALMADTSSERAFKGRAFLEADRAFASIHGPPPEVDEEEEHVGNLVAGTAALMIARKAVRQEVPPKGMSGVGEIARGRFGCIMISKYKRALIDAIEEQSKASAKDMKKHGGKRVIFDVWPAHSKIFDNSTDCAYPHKKGSPFGPMLVYFVWEGATNDQYWTDEMERALDKLRQIALSVGCTDEKLPLYSNTSLSTTQVSKIYQENYEGLKQIRLKYDPQDVMKRAGGFKI